MSYLYIEIDSNFTFFLKFRILLYSAMMIS